MEVGGRYVADPQGSSVQDLNNMIPQSTEYQPLITSTFQSRYAWLLAMHGYMDILLGSASLPHSIQ